MFVLFVLVYVNTLNKVTKKENYFNKLFYNHNNKVHYSLQSNN